jgi:enoyl-CoA hydratase/carnithine racemase
MYSNLKLVKEEHIAVLSLNRPQAMNALDTKTAAELLAALEELELDGEVFAVVLTAEGDKAFCVGADLKERKTMSREEVKKQRALFVRAFTAAAEFAKPMVAAVNGYALGGGCEFALCCDFIIASEKASFGLPEVGLAVIPGGGGTQLLPRAVGRNKAKELIFTGRHISAGEALDIGLVNYVTPPEKLMEKTMEIMKEITKTALSPFSRQSGPSTSAWNWNCIPPWPWKPSATMSAWLPRTGTKGLKPLTKSASRYTGAANEERGGCLHVRL